jgi:hypothetical protein
MSFIPSCKDVTEHASDYLERNLTFRQRLGYRIHLFICISCRRYLSQLKLTIATLAKMPGASPQPASEKQVQDIVSHLHQHTKKKD